MEFALIVPILLTLVFGIIDFGLYINAAAVVGNAAREGARTGALGGSESGIDSVVSDAISELPGDPLTNATITVSCLTPAGGACSSYDSDAEPGGTAVVSVTYDHGLLTPVWSGALTIVKTSEMRIE